MKRPHVLALLVAHPLVAALAFIVCLPVVWEWYQGHMLWLVGLGAVVAMAKTVTAIDEVQRYKAWKAEWDAQNDTKAASKPKKRHGANGDFILAWVLLGAIPGYLAKNQIDPLLALALKGFCVLLAMFVAFRLLRIGLGRLAAWRARRAEIAKDAPVSWLVGRASSSPSRAEVLKNLPDYCMTLIDKEDTTFQGTRALH